MSKIDKESLISQLDQEISYAKVTGAPQLVAGLQRAKQIVERQQPVKIEDLGIKHMKIEDEVVKKIEIETEKAEVEEAVGEGEGEGEETTNSKF